MLTQPLEAKLSTTPVNDAKALAHSLHLDEFFLVISAFTEVALLGATLRKAPKISL